MSPSSGSWPSGPGDIIDLDRYMRGNVRPSRPLSDDSNQCEKLVVDSGGCKHRSSASGDARYKRASLDSGVSDGSYWQARYKRTKHRRGGYPDNYSYFCPPDRALTKTPSRANSSKSMRAFRTVCEQALLEQQQQIARVTLLCERLAERAEKSEKVERNEQKEQTEPPQKSVRREQSVDSSEISSSSRSTKDPRRKDTNRTEECKTYKIIMSKLEEMNRLFATRKRAPRPPRTQRTPSSSSVSVCDKLVATDPQRTYNRVLAPTQRIRCTDASVAPASLTSAPRVSQVYAVDIAPPVCKDVRANVLTERIVKYETSTDTTTASACDPRCGFDLDDPVHLYSQAKRLRSPRRPRSPAPAPSLCALCRGYWRYLWQCLPTLVRPLDSCKCS